MHRSSIGGSLGVLDLHSPRAITPYYLLIFGLLALMPGLAGCWSGHLMASQELAYRHPAVQWVYRAGGQLGSIFFVPTIVQNCVHGIESGSDYVIVKEGGRGCIEWAPWRPVTALNLQTGRGMLAKPAGDQAAFIHEEWNEARKSFVANIGHGVELLLPMPSSEIYIRQTDCAEEDSIKILGLAGSNTFGASIDAVWFSEKLLVIGMHEGYVICIDLKKADLYRPQRRENNRLN